MPSYHGPREERFPGQAPHPIHRRIKDSSRRWNWRTPPAWGRVLAPSSRPPSLSACCRSALPHCMFGGGTCPDINPIRGPGYAARGTTGTREAVARPRQSRQPGRTLRDRGIRAASSTPRFSAETRPESTLHSAPDVGYSSVRNRVLGD